VPNVVLDTNVLVSALLSRSALSTASRAVWLARSRFRLCLSPWIIGEFRGVLQRPKFARYEFDSESVDAFVASLLAGAAVLNPTERVSDCSDADDNRVLEVALAGEAVAIVTGDRILQEMHPWRGVPVIAPARFLQRFGAD
jgi:putative PIN family toxin of toxin-antitoxin system